MAKAAFVSVERPDQGELEMAIHALSTILETISFVIHEETGMPEEREMEMRDGLLIAGGLITTDLRRRF